MHEIHVSVVGAEEASSNGTAEFWAGDRLIGFTRLDDGDLMFQIEPNHDGSAVVVGAHSLAEALAEAILLLARDPENHSPRRGTRAPHNTAERLAARGQGGFPMSTSEPSEPERDVFDHRANRGGRLRDRPRGSAGDPRGRGRDHSPHRPPRLPAAVHPRRGGRRPARRPDRPRESHRGGPGDALPDRSPPPWASRRPRSTAAAARTCVPRAPGHRAAPPPRRHPCVRPRTCSAITSATSSAASAAHTTSPL